MTDEAKNLLAGLVLLYGNEDALKRELSRVSRVLQAEKVSPAILLMVLGGSARVRMPGAPTAHHVAELAAAFEAGHELAATARTSTLFRA